VLNASLVERELDPLRGEPAQGVQVGEHSRRLEERLWVGEVLRPGRGEPRIDLAKHLKCRAPGA
jgi:hypothetical protein